MLRNSRVAERLAASQEGLSSTELVSYQPIPGMHKSRPTVHALAIRTFIQPASIHSQHTYVHTYTKYIHTYFYTYIQTHTCIYILTYVHTYI
jgi:hypothetical protein